MKTKHIVALTVEGRGKVVREIWAETSAEVVAAAVLWLGPGAKVLEAMVNGAWHAREEIAK